MTMLHDAIAAERHGIPAVVVMTDRFERRAQAIAEANGLPGYGYAVIPHPVANNDDTVLRAKAGIAMRRIVPLLLERHA